MPILPHSHPFDCPSAWEDYELLDAGDGMKRERWGEVILIRPDIAASWPRGHLEAWKQCDGSFDSKTKKWTWTKSVPSSWKINYRDLQFLIRPTSSKQVGLFPEQACNWDWCVQKIKSAERPIKVLNLFGYTGAASIVAAAAGASVCHVDSSQAMVSWCAENAKINFCDQGKKAAIRLIVDDCAKFIAREKRRNNRYDAIILDPPTFGRAQASSIWKLEDHLLSLMESCRALLSDHPLFLMMSTYSPFFSSTQLHSLLQEIFNDHAANHTSVISLGLRSSHDQHILPCGMTARLEFC